MFEDIGRSLSTDYFPIADQLTGEELSYLQPTRDFVDNEVMPVINGTGSGRSIELHRRLLDQPAPVAVSMAGFRRMVGAFRGQPGPAPRHSHLAALAPANTRFRSTRQLMTAD